MRRARSPERKEQRRQALLDAALDTFFLKGFALARMEDIAQAAGVSKGTIYLYFDSKEAIFKALVETIALPNLSQLQSLLEADIPLEAALDSLATLLPEIVSRTSLPKLAKILIADSQAFPDMVSYYREQVVDRVLLALTRLLERAQERGEIRRVNAALTARLVISPVLFSVIWKTVFEPVGRDSLNIESLLALHVGYLKLGLGLSAGEQLPC